MVSLSTLRRVRASLHLNKHKTDTPKSDLPSEIVSGRMCVCVCVVTVGLPLHSGLPTIW